MSANITRNAAAVQTTARTTTDPAARALMMEQLRVQVMQKTRLVPEADRLVVRERLRRQLDHAGFFFEEATYILSSLDYPRRRV